MESTQVDSIVEIAANLAGKADTIDSVLILYTTRDVAGGRSLDNRITVQEALFLVESFKHWLLSQVNQPNPKE